MTGQQRTDYVGAFTCLMGRPPRGIFNQARSLYEEMVFVHNNMVDQIHGSDIFLPWHRYYLYMLRSFMSTECGFNGPYPWWKETNNVGNFGASDIFSAQWFGALPPANGNNGFCISNGAFANLRNPISGQCVARGERRDMSANSNFANEDYVNSRGSYSDFRANIEGLNHAYGHLAIGPTMSSTSQSPADPIFFLHHSYIDWSWKRWQNQQSGRWTTINGCADKRSPCTPLTVNTQLTSMNLFRAMSVGELLDTEGDTGCYTYDLLV
ncbi:tyrosinase [Microdochium nivale]|nr:tyrosinase [Microdochium nivale]